MTATINIGELRPGDVIHLDDMTQLPKLEDMIANLIDSEPTSDMVAAWRGRPPIKELLRPKLPRTYRYNGTVSNIGLVVMENPYDRLLDARSRGWTIPSTKLPDRNVKHQAVKRSFRGFEFTADANSAGHGPVSQLQAELWYGFVPFQDRVTEFEYDDGSVMVRTAQYFNTKGYGGASVRRFVTVPKCDEARFIAVYDISRSIGFALLRSGISNPYSSAMH